MSILDRQATKGGDETKIVTQRTETDQECSCRLFDIVVFLKKQGFGIHNTTVYFYSRLFSNFVNCNLDPVSKTIWLQLSDLETIDGRLSLRLKFIRAFAPNNIDLEEEGKSEDEASLSQDVHRSRREGEGAEMSHLRKTSGYEPVQ